MMSSISTSFDRTLTNDGDDRPESSSHNPLHLSSSSITTDFISARSAHRSTRSNSSPSSSPITGRNTISSPFTGIRTDEGSSRSYMSGCSNTRTICGVQVPKQDTNSTHSNSTNHCWMSERSLDCREIAFAPVSPSAASMNNASTSTHTSSSQSTHLTCWTTETKLARSQQQMKCLEGRFQRERSKRRTLEEDRDLVLNFVKGLLLESEEETKIDDTRSKNSKRGKRPRTKSMSSISLFVSQYEGKPQDQSDSYDSDEDELDCYNSPNQQDANSKQQEKEGLANTLRTFLQHPPIAAQQQWDDIKQEEAERHVEELENLHSRFEQSTQEHYEELDSMEHRFRDERETATSNLLHQLYRGKKILRNSSFGRIRHPIRLPFLVVESGKTICITKSNANAFSQKSRCVLAMI